MDEDTCDLNPVGCSSRRQNRACAGKASNTGEQQQLVQGSTTSSSTELLCCTICHGMLDRAVACDPCDHTFCATCLSHHLGCQLLYGVALTCPLCATPVDAVAAQQDLRSAVQDHVMQWDLAQPHSPDQARRSPRPQLPAAAPQAPSDAGGATSPPQTSGPTTSGYSRGDDSKRQAAQLRGSKRLPVALSAAQGHGLPSDPNMRHLETIFAFLHTPQSGGLEHAQASDAHVPASRGGAEHERVHSPGQGSPVGCGASLSHTSPPRQGHWHGLAAREAASASWQRQAPHQEQQEPSPAQVHHTTSTWARPGSAGVPGQQQHEQGQQGWQQAFGTPSPSHPEHDHESPPASGATGHSRLDLTCMGSPGGPVSCYLGAHASAGPTGSRSPSPVPSFPSPCITGASSGSWRTIRLTREHEQQQQQQQGQAQPHGSAGLFSTGSPSFLSPFLPLPPAGLPSRAPLPPASISPFLPLPPAGLGPRSLTPAGARTRRRSVDLATLGSPNTLWAMTRQTLGSDLSSLWSHTSSPVSQDAVTSPLGQRAASGSMAEAAAEAEQVGGRAQDAHIQSARYGSVGSSGPWSPNTWQLPLSPALAAALRAPQDPDQDDTDPGFEGPLPADSPDWQHGNPQLQQDQRSRRHQQLHAPQHQLHHRSLAAHFQLCSHLTVPHRGLSSLGICHASYTCSYDPAHGVQQLQPQHAAASFEAEAEVEVEAEQGCDVTPSRSWGGAGAGMNSALRPRGTPHHDQAMRRTSTASASPASGQGARSPSKLARLTRPSAPGAPQGRSAHACGESEDGGRWPVEQPRFAAPAALHLLCPLHDTNLPMELAHLKPSLVEGAMLRLRAAVSHGSPCFSSLPSLLRALEILASVCWCDDEAREAVGAAGGVAVVAAVMKLYCQHAAVQAGACMVLMALVRGEGEVCLANQWHIAKAGGVEAVVACMRAYPLVPEVQLAALLCLVPASLENPMAQASVCYEGLDSVLAALAAHPQHTGIQTKGLVLLGVLLQGDEPLLEALRQRQLEANTPRHVVAALKGYGEAVDEVLWAALFAASMITRPDSLFFDQAVSSFARHGGLVPMVHRCLQAYCQRMASKQQAPDPMVLQGGYSLCAAVDTAAAKRKACLQTAAMPALAFLTGAALVGLIAWKRSFCSAAGAASSSWLSAWLERE